MEKAKEVQVVNFEEYAMTPDKLVGQISLIQQVMEKVMKPSEHYGTIPGCGDKPALLKPGAEKLSTTFRLAPEYKITKTGLPEGHREYEVICTLTHMPTSQFVGQGVGLCSTMESKYRYRNVSDYEITGEDIPKDAKERKAEYRKQGFGMKKIDGAWHWVKYKADSKTENPDIADTYNTVLKMAKKRAHVDAILTATAASDIFTQDIEDTPRPIDVTPKPRQQKDDFPKIMEAERKRVGDKAFYDILGGYGFEDADQIPDRESQIEVYNTLKKTDTKRE